MPSMDLKYCYVCNNHFPQSKFYHNRSKKDGFSDACKKCTNRYKNRYKKKRKKIPSVKTAEQEYNRTYEKKVRSKKIAINNYIVLERLLMGCVDCEEKNILVLEFDHLRDKHGNIGNLRIRANPEVLIQELDKCVVRCANCHHIKTAKERGSWKLDLMLAKKESEEV